ncbi:hypothetical protein MCB86_02245 [Pseudomonas sp. KSR10]|nr:hypothetical protein [Pseudomonas sp. KSR10]
MTATEFSKRFGVSEDTIRHDLKDWLRSTRQNKHSSLKGMNNK